MIPKHVTAASEGTGFGKSLIYAFFQLPGAQASHQAGLDMSCG